MGESGRAGRGNRTPGLEAAVMGARPFPRAPVSGGGVPGGGGEEPAVTDAVPCRAEEGQQEADLPQALQDPEEGESRRAAPALASGGVS